MKQAAKIMHVCSVKTKNPPEQILPLEQNSLEQASFWHGVKLMCSLTTLFYTQHIPGSNWNSSDDQWFSIAGPQDCRFVFPLNIIYNALFLFCTYSLHHQMFWWLWLLLVQPSDISNSLPKGKNIRDSRWIVCIWSLSLSNHLRPDHAPLWL